MKKLIILILSFVVMFITGCGEKKETTVNKNVYIAVADPDYSPFEYIDANTGKITGFEIDLINEMAKRANFNIEVSTAPFTNVLQQISDGKADVGLGAFTINEKRKNIANFIEYMTSDVVVIGNSTLKSLDDKDALYAVKVGTSYIDLLKDKKGVTPIEKTAYDVMVLRLIEKEVDYIVMDKAAADKYIKMYPELFIKETLAVDTLGIALSKNLSDDFKNKMNKALSDMKSDGTFDSLKKKYGL